MDRLLDCAAAYDRDEEPCETRQPSKPSTEIRHGYRLARDSADRRGAWNDARVMIERAEPFRFGDGASLGVGSLPHRDFDAAAAFAISEFDIATIPSLPQASPLESMIEQAAEPIDGVGFTALRTFLDLTTKVSLDGGPVKWQFVGPVTLGIEYIRAGVDTATAFRRAVTVVRTKLAELSELVTAAVPGSPQLVVLDEPWFCDLMTPGFPIPPDEAVDILSSAMAALPTSSVAGVHCCAPSDIAMLLASGPSVISVPVSADLVEWAGYISRFLDDGGIVAWGVIPTDGPIPSSADRNWRALSDVWCSLVQLGCDPILLRQQSLVSPQCGLAEHSVAVARRIARLTSDVGRRVKDQAAATRLSLGA